MLLQPDRISHGRRFGFIATLASEALAAGKFMDCLTVREKERLAGFSNEQRRKKWLAGRLAGKYLYLNRSETDFQSGSQETTFLELTHDHLESFPARMYRCVEILPEAGSPRNAPRLKVEGEDASRSADISLSHTDGLSCACLAYNAAVAVDLERSVPRVDSFYLKNFTRLERAWVRGITNRHDINPLWLYTVLWSLKEAALKSQHSGEMSVWDIPKIEIKVMAETTDWARLYLCRTLGNEFLYFTVGIEDPYGSQDAQIALTATNHLILVILKLEEGAV